MAQVADGGGGSGARVEITIERIEEIARTMMASMDDTARNKSSDFRNTKLSQGVFGQYDRAQEFAAQQDAAHQVFVETIQGVIADLRAFQENLLASARTSRRTDEAAESSLTVKARNDQAVTTAMAKVDSRFGEDYTYNAQEQYDEARTDKDLDVGTSTEPSEGQSSASDSDLPQPATEAPQDATAPDEGSASTYRP